MFVITQCLSFTCHALWMQLGYAAHDLTLNLNSGSFIEIIMHPFILPFFFFPFFWAVDSWSVIWPCWNLRRNVESFRGLFFTFIDTSGSEQPCGLISLFSVLVQGKHECSPVVSYKICQFDRCQIYPLWECCTVHRGSIIICFTWKLMPHKVMFFICLNKKFSALFTNCKML